MPFISPEVVKERTSSPDNLINRLKIIEIVPPGKRPEIPEPIQKLAAVLANDEDNDESQSDIGRALGMSQQRVSAYSLGRTTNHIDSTKPELKRVVDKVQERNRNSMDMAEDKAISALLIGLDLVKEKLPHSRNLKTISTVVKDMATVAEKMRPPSENEAGAAQVHLHIYAPKSKTIDDYEVIDV